MKEESFGIIPLRKSPNWQVFLIQNKKGGHIGFPKGHKELSEDPKRTAVRELKEETNLDVLKFFDKTFEESYSFEKNGIKVEKKVKYFLALADGEIKLQKEEISGGFWTDLDKALKKMTFPEGKKIILEVKKFMEEAV